MKRRLLLLIIGLALLMSSCAPGQGGSLTPTPPQGQNSNTIIAGWDTWNPTDPTAPTVLNQSDKGYKLKADWQIATIEYLYGWWGLGEPGDDHQIIERSGNEFKRNGASVSQSDIDSFVAALDHLYPTQSLLSWSAWTDDYPQWTIEITGSDGQHILLDSSSTGNPGNGPWNVLYNGRLYAQYDGAVGAALGKLFGGRLARAEGNPFGDHPAGLVSFRAGGLPTQLIYGFWGLVPVSNGFSYIADPKKSEIIGQVTGQSRIGSMQIGQIDKLGRVQLLSKDGAAVDCKIEDLPEGDPFTPVTRWKFTCPIPGAKQGERYSYPIVVQFGTEKGATTKVKGELLGTWRTGDPEIAMPPPAGLGEAFANHPSTKDLLTDHQLSPLLYTGQVEPSNPMSGTFQGEAILLGQTEQDSKKTRYTIGTPFSIEGGELDYWGLDRGILNSMVGSIMKLPTTLRVIKADPSVVVNMWYAKSRPQGRRFELYGQGGTRYIVKVNPCGSVKGAILPSETSPLEAFGYNNRRSLDMVDFVLIDGKPVVADLDLFPLYDKDPARLALVPAEFDTGNSRAFSRVWMQGKSLFERFDDEDKLLQGGTELTLYIPDDTTAAERTVYEKVAKALPGNLETDTAWWTVRGMTFTPKDDGSLTVVGCSQK